MTILDITTVTDTSVTVHVTPQDPDGPVEVHVTTGLASDTDHEIEVPTGEGETERVTVRTLATPAGELRSVFATVNDVHFGETVAGQIDDSELGPLRYAAPGADPYPEVMNRAAAGEIAAINPAAVIVKGDLTQDGTDAEFAAFEACYRTPFGNRLHVVRGNHDAYHHQSVYSGDQRIELDGITVALLDTVIVGGTTGNLVGHQFEWLDEVARSSDQPVIAMGHHPQWIGGPAAEANEAKRSESYFGLHPDASDQLDEVFARRSTLIAYAAGHTHRHRVRPMTTSGVPSIEIGCTKDFPGTWAEYRVYDGGVMQVVHRMSTPEALAWSEPCRDLYADFGIAYSTYALGNLTDRCFVINLR